MVSITQQIAKRIRAKRRGWVFAPKDFLDLGARTIVDQALSRLARQGTIRRLGRGIYDFPKQHPTLGTLSPDTDSLARAVIKPTDGIFVSGASAANMLGLSTQVPAKITYTTNGPSHAKKIAGQTLVFKHARVPLLAHKSDKVNLTLQALSFVGKHNMDDQIVQQCAKALDDRDILGLTSSAADAPGWMAGVILKIQKAKRGQIRKQA
jgi:hypothetical protein